MKHSSTFKNLSKMEENFRKRNNKVYLSELGRRYVK